MTVAALLLGIAAFVVVLRMLGAAGIATSVISVSQTAIATMGTPDLDDLAKEAAVRRASLQLFGSFAALLGVSLAALGAAAAVVWGGAAAGLYPLDRAIAVGSGWPFILVSSVGSVALWLALERRAAPRAAAPKEVPYSGLDQALHDYALGSLDRQRRLAGVEDRLFAARIARTRMDAPVFVTSLPRAGTTMMLGLLAEMPEFASATYRHMPFPMAPLLWGRFSRPFRRAGAPVERAHGDGIEVGLDSPEAFEEMLWMAFWPGHYGPDRIRLWDADADVPGFRDFLARHMAKVVAAEGGPARRYVSKNNANIARLPLLARLFPESQVVVPVRDPFAQTASLLRQHRRFTDLHAREPFARRYMQGIGHLEFGAALKPIAFPGFDTAATPDSPSFWLAYWIAAYRTVLATAAHGTLFVDHDALSAAPERLLPVLADRIGVADPAAFAALAPRLHPQRAVAPAGLPDDLVEAARALHQTLVARSA